MRKLTASGYLCVSVAALFTGLPLQAATVVIHAGHLIVEPGKPSSTDASIVISEGKIVAVKSGLVAGDQVFELKDSWVMPGMMDMHTHISGVERLDQPAGPQIALFYLGRPAEAVLNTLPRAKAMLMDGFTTIRNVGDPTFTTYSLRDAITTGIVPGPRYGASVGQAGGGSQVLRTATTNAAAALGGPGQVSFRMKEGVIYKDER